GRATRHEHARRRAGARSRGAAGAGRLMIATPRSVPGRSAGVAIVDRRLGSLPNPLRLALVDVGADLPDVGVDGVIAPEAHRPVAAGGGEHLAVGAEGDAVDRGDVAGERRAELAVARHIPEAHHLVDAGGGERLAVGAEGDAVHLAAVPGERPAEPAMARHMPEAR